MLLSSHLIECDNKKRWAYLNPVYNNFVKNTDCENETLGKRGFFAHHFHRVENAAMTPSRVLKEDSCGLGQPLQSVLGSEAFLVK